MANAKIVTPAPSRHPSQREDIEAWLDEKGVRWTFKPDVPVAKINVEKSLRNQARINQVLNEAQVETYVEAMKRGDSFPGIIVYLEGSKYIAVDGNHRIAAAAVTTEKISVYELAKDTAAQVLVAMTYEANAKHGLPNSIDERLRHAVHMIESAGASQEMAASRLNLSKAAVGRAWSKHKADNRARDVGLTHSQWDGFNPAVKMRLGSVSTDEGFAALADLAARANLTSEEVDRAVVSMNASRSSNEQKKIVEQLVDVYRPRIQKGGKGVADHRMMGPKRNILLAHGHIRTGKDKSEALLEALKGPEREEFAAKCVEAAIWLADLAEAIREKAKSEDEAEATTKAK